MLEFLQEVLHFVTNQQLLVTAYAPKSKITKENSLQYKSISDKLHLLIVEELQKFGSIQVNDEHNFTDPDTDRNAIGNELNNSSNQFESSFHVCAVCGKEFGDLKLLKSHAEEHVILASDELTPSSKPIKTEIELNSMDPDFNTSENNIYTTASEFAFPYQNYEESQYSENEKYSCGLCGKKYTQRTTMIRHKREFHANEATHLCTYCGKSFKRKHDLKRHIRLHTGEKPFKCTICSKAFNQKQLLTGHTKRYHGDIV